MKIEYNELEKNNPWWLNDDYLPEEINWFHRNLFFDLKKKIENQFILNILGLRRVGKSSIIKQLIAVLLKKNIKSENIFYFLFDYSIQINSAEFLDKLINFYIEEIAQKKIYNIDKKIYIFLDEIQYIDNWQSILKKYYDLSNKKIKFIISGSQSLLLINKNKESLAGRLFEYYLSPLDFYEFIQIKKVRNLDLDKIKLRLLDVFNIDKNFIKFQKFNIKYKKVLKLLAQEYILNGQFPECISIKDDKQKNEYILKSVLGKIFIDIVKIAKIEKSEKFKLVSFQFLNNCGSIFELKNIGREIGLSYITLEKYIQYLIDGYLFRIMFKDHKSIIKKGRSLKKIYATSSNFICVYNKYEKKHFNEVPEDFGKIIENLVYNILIKKYDKLSFWRKEDKEVDFIIKSNNNILPIEVKFRNNVRLDDIKNIVYYCKIKNLNKAIIVTKDILSIKNIKNIELYYIPYYLMLV